MQLQLSRKVLDVNYDDKFVQCLKIERDGGEVVYRRPSNAIYCNNGPQQVVPDSIWKEIWKVKDGELVLIETKQGQHVPARHVPETFTFDE